MSARHCLAGRGIFIFTVSAAISVTAFGQAIEPLTVTGKLKFHAETTLSPVALLGTAAYAGVLQAAAAPTEWGGGAGPYGKRFVSTLGWSGVHSTMAFGLDSALHQDPRYFRSTGKGFWRRSGHALRGTLLTRRDSGGETFSTWRVGSAYGAAFISNLWYPDRLNTMRLGVLQGTVTLGFGLIGNVGAEFWPDIKRKVLHR